MQGRRLPPPSRNPHPPPLPTPLPPPTPSYSYNLVLYKHGELLYNGVIDTVREHLLSIAATLSATPNGLLLPKLRTAWADSKHDISLVADVFMYLDRTYVNATHKTPVYDAGISSFRELVLCCPTVLPRVQAGLLEVVAKSREGESTGGSGGDGDDGAATLRAVIVMLVELGVGTLNVYADCFEAPFLRATEDYYAKDAASARSTLSTGDYLAFVEKRLAGEDARLRATTHTGTVPKALSAAYTELVTKPSPALVEAEGSGLVYLLEHDRIGDLARMHALFASPYVKGAVAWKPSGGEGGGAGAVRPPRHHAARGGAAARGGGGKVAPHRGRRQP